MVRRSSTILVLIVAGLPFAAKADSVLISSYFDDPFVDQSVIKRMDPLEFGQAADGRPTLRSTRVWITDEDFVYRQDDNGDFQKFSWNPWPQSWTNPRWNLIYPGEERFPVFRLPRDANNQVVMKDGLQVWIPQDLNLANTTAFDAANSVKDAAEFWSGRYVNWGIEGGRLGIETHAFIGFNSFYSPSARELFFGVVPYRLPGHTDTNMFETATSWEMVAHEAGHALEHALKPNIYPDAGYVTGSESFADQTAMWTSLRNPERVSRLLAETKGDLNQSNSLTRIAEVFAVLLGKGTGIRDAFHDLKVSGTTEEVHDRSQVLTGAAYRTLLAIYDEQRRRLRDEDALSEAGRIMGLFLTHSLDYAPEDRLVLQDIVKGYLKVDKEFFGGRHYDMLVNEFMRRELLDANSLRDWQAHEEALPHLWLPNWSTDSDAVRFVEQNQDRLGAGPEFGLNLQSVTRLGGASQGRMIVRVQLTQARGADAVPLDNHGILVFRANGDLADYHPPIPGGPPGGLPPAEALRAQAVAAIGKAREARLHFYGVPLALVRGADGSISAEAHVLRGEGLNAYMEVFTPDNPRGERREILESPLSPEQRLKIQDALAF